MNVRQYIFEEPSTAFVRFDEASNYVHPNRKFVNRKTKDDAIIEFLFKLYVDPVGEPAPEDIVDDFMEHGLILDFNDKSEEEIDEYIRDTANHNTILKCKSFFYRPLHLAARKGDFELVKDLIAAGADTNQTLSPLGPSETPLESAIRGDNVEIVKYLIDHGANFRGNKEEDELVFLVLVYAFRFESKNVIKVYLTEDTDLTGVSWAYGSLINCAVYNGDLDLIQQVLECGGHVNSLAVYSKKFKWFHGTLIPLQTAIALKRVDIVKLLIRNGANVDQRLPGRDDQRSTLEFAVDTNASNDIIIALLDAGADVFCVNDCYILPWNYPHRHPSFTNLLKKMALKLKIAGFNVWKTNKLERIIKDKKLVSFQKECFREIERMANTEIGMTFVTYHELLTTTVLELARDEDYDDLKSAVSNEDLETQFPLYAGIIQARFRNVVETKINLSHFENLMINLFPGAPIASIHDLIAFVCDEGLEAFKSKGRFAFQDLFKLKNKYF